MGRRLDFPVLSSWILVSLSLIHIVQDEIFGFTKALIRFRKEHSVLHSQKELKILDTLGCGYPDISYHGTEAWRPDLSYISRMIGIMLCGNYAEKQDEPSIYIAYNTISYTHLGMMICM